LSPPEQSTSPTITTFEFAQLEEPAHIGMSSADVLSAAWVEVDQVREQARITGEEEGRAAGLAAAAEECKTAIGSLAAAVTALENEREQFMDESETRLFEKVQAQQEREIELDQREEELKVKMRKFRESEAVGDAHAAATLKAEDEAAADDDEMRA